MSYLYLFVDLKEGTAYKFPGRIFKKKIVGYPVRLVIIISYLFRSQFLEFHAARAIAPIM